MKKKGFTLVELLAVIAILAILVIIALPNVLSMYNEARKNTFATEVKDHYKAAEQKFMLNAGQEIVFTNLPAADVKKDTKYENSEVIALEMSGSKKTNYLIVFNAAGDCTRLIAENGTYGVNIDDTKILIEDIGTSKSANSNTKYDVLEADGSFKLEAKTENSETTIQLTGKVKEDK